MATLAGCIVAQLLHAAAGFRRVGVPLELPAEDFEFIMEGNMNIVVGYRGKETSWQGYALRCRKTGASSGMAADEAFTTSVAGPLFGDEFVDRPELVTISADSMQAINERIFKKRDKKRQDKSIDVTEKEKDQGVVAWKLPNLLSAPLRELGMVTVEIKPKCGLIEYPGIPSRYTLLQYQKKAEGKEEKISEYDPVALLSQDPWSVKRTLEAALQNPQNNLRIFVGHKELNLRKWDEDALNEQLQRFVVGRVDALLALVAGVMSSTSLPLRLKRAQALAAGRASELVGRLYTRLRELGEDPNTLITEAATLSLALQGLGNTSAADFGMAVAAERMAASAGDFGMAAAAERMDFLLSKPVDDTLSLDIAVELCRFLLGRTAQDVSLMLNFVPSPESVGAADGDWESRYRKLRFRPIEELAPPGPVPEGGWWFRATVVDVDQKPPGKIPEYATQFDKALWYYREYQAEHRAQLLQPAAPVHRASFVAGGTPGKLDASPAAIPPPGGLGKRSALQSEGQSSAGASSASPNKGGGGARRA